MSNIPEEHRIDDETVDRHTSHLQKLEQRSQQLEYGPGGIMEMKQTIANKEAEINRLENYRNFVILLANEPLELSYEKIELQRNYWKKKAGKLLDRLENDNE
jgi:hypothetical protein